MDEKMIKEYIFYDSYDWDNCGIEEEHNIEGGDYKKLIIRLFKYSSCFSLSFNAPELTSRNCVSDFGFDPHKIFFDYDNRTDYHEYDKYIIKKADMKPPQGFPGICLGHELRFYRCCDATLEFFLTKFDSIFSFAPYCNHNPEDPYFYRSDGSVLFASEIHEGECFLFPRDGEDFSDILTTLPWCTTEITEDFYRRRFLEYAHKHMSIKEFNE